LRARLGSSQGRFNLLKHSSIGDKSGEYGGTESSRARRWTNAQGGIGLLADQLAHQRQGCGVAAWPAPSGMRPWGNLPGRTPPPQLLQKRVADTEQGG
jgi:hypothetical protein